MRHSRWISLLTGGTLFGMAANGCNPDLQAIAAGGAASLLTSIVNSFIENTINGVFNLPNFGGFNF